MQKLGVTIAVLCIGLLPVLAQEKADIEEDKKLIEEAFMNYIEGWYEGSVERMDKALHPDLIKWFMRYGNDGKAVTNSVTKDDMLTDTRMGGGTKSHNNDKENVLTILDISATIASVKCVSGGLCGLYADGQS